MFEFKDFQVVVQRESRFDFSVARKNFELPVFKWLPYRHSDLGLVHTMPDKFENATLRAKTEQMFCVHTRVF